MQTNDFLIAVWGRKKFKGLESALECETLSGFRSWWFLSVYNEVITSQKNLD